MNIRKAEIGIDDDGNFYVANPSGSNWRLLSSLLGENGGSVPFPVQAGDGSPVGVVTPTEFGVVYVDTTLGGIYISVPGDDINPIVWQQVGGNGGGNTTGIDGRPEGGTSLLTADAGLDQNNYAVISDLDSYYNGHTNGVYWNADGTDGHQTLQVQTGTTGQHLGTLQDGNGTTLLAEGGLIFPTVDPHIAGAWWDNAGVLTKSAG